MWQQLITPNPNVPCTPNMCLQYVRQAAGIGAKYPSAIAGWNASPTQHRDQDFPANGWVPVWFTLTDNQYGHVVWRQPDGSIWSTSSPTSSIPVHHAGLDALIKYYGKDAQGRIRLGYLGWTEDVEGKSVIKEVKGMTPGEVDLAFMVGFNRPANEEEKKTWAGRPPADVLLTIFNNNLDFRSKAANYDELKGKYEAAIVSPGGEVNKQTVVDYIDKNLK